MVIDTLTALCRIGPIRRWASGLRGKGWLESTASCATVRVGKVS